MVIFIGSLVGILTVETVRSSNPTEFFGDYYARSAVNDVKRVQTSYIKKIPLFNDGFAEILLLVVTRPKFLTMS